MMNSVTVAQFFKAVSVRIFKRFLVVKSIKNGLLELVSIYFVTIEINGQKMLYLYCQVCLRKIFHLVEL